MRDRIAKALDDVVTAYRRRKLWMALAAEDITDQHRRTRLGPVWLLLNYVAFVVILVLVFHRGGGSEHYAAYVAIGLLVWTYITEVINAGIIVFVRDEAFVRGTPLPLTVYVMRMTAQSIIRAGFPLIGCLGILAFSGLSWTPAALWAIPGILLLVAMAPPVIMIAGVIGAYLPDSQFIVNTLLRFGLFLTPIIWVSSGDVFRETMAAWNPFTHAIEMVRSPVLYGEVPGMTYALFVLAVVLSWMLAILLLASVRKQLVHVL